MTTNQKQKDIADLKNYVNFYLDGNKSVDSDKLILGLIDGLKQLLKEVSQ